MRAYIQLKWKCQKKKKKNIVPNFFSIIELNWSRKLANLEIVEAAETVAVRAI